MWSWQPRGSNADRSLHTGSVAHCQITHSGSRHYDRCEVVFEIEFDCVRLYPVATVLAHVIFEWLSLVRWGMDVTAGLSAPRGGRGDMTHELSTTYRRILANLGAIYHVSADSRLRLRRMISKI